MPREETEKKTKRIALISTDTEYTLNKILLEKKVKYN